MPLGGAAERARLRRYAEAIGLWNAHFDTAAIAARLDVPESTAARWVANFRDVMRTTQQKNEHAV